MLLGVFSGAFVRALSRFHSGGGGSGGGGLGDFVLAGLAGCGCGCTVHLFFEARIAHSCCVAIRDFLREDGVACYFVPVDLEDTYY